MASDRKARSGGQTVRKKELVIPELERIASSTPHRCWLPEEEAVLRTYYGRVPAHALAEYLTRTFRRKRTVAAIYHKAVALGLTARRDETDQTQA